MPLLLVVEQETTKFQREASSEDDVI
jgi:hypothetical protein